jgi:hypothetical protein
LIFDQKYNCQAKYPASRISGIWPLLDIRYRYPAFELAGYPAGRISGKNSLHIFFVAHEAGLLTSEDGVINAPEGSIITEDGSLVAADGTVLAPPGSVVAAEDTSHQNQIHQVNKFLPVNLGS